MKRWSGRRSGLRSSPVMELSRAKEPASTTRFEAALTGSAARPYLERSMALIQRGRRKTLFHTPIPHCTTFAILAMRHIIIAHSAMAFANVFLLLQWRSIGTSNSLSLFATQAIVEEVIADREIGAYAALVTRVHA